MGETIRATADLTGMHGFGCAKLVVFANAVSDNPFMAGAFHGVQEADTTISVGVSGPGVVHRALQRSGRILRHLRRRNQEGSFQDYPRRSAGWYLASERLGVPFNIIDLSWHPPQRLATRSRTSSKRWV